MSTRRFNVALDGADASGRYRVIYKILAADEHEAVVLARASAALHDIAVLDVGGTVDLGPSPEEAGDLRRVLGRTAKIYQVSDVATEAETSRPAGRPA